METPYRLALDSLDELICRIQNHAGSYYVLSSEGGWVCKDCGASILSIEVKISLHIQEEEECVGPRIEGGVLIPFCPECEERPEEFGCVHLPPESPPRFSVRIVGGSDFGGCIPEGY